MIAVSAQFILTGGTEIPGLHVALIIVNTLFGAVSARNMILLTITEEMHES